MDPTQDNQRNAGTGDNRQAIFSTQPEQDVTQPTQPEQSVQLETQPESSPSIDTSEQSAGPVVATVDSDNTTASSTSLSHPYFSNHPTQTFNTEAGDIVLHNGTPKPKQNKRPFIIGGIILAVFVVILLVILAARSISQTNNKKNPKITFENYYQYLTAGPEDLDYSPENDAWFIFTLEDSELSSGEQNDYLNELQKKFQLAHANLQSNSDNTNFKERLTYYSSLLTVIGTYNILVSATDIIANYIFTNDEPAAQDYIAKLTPESIGLADAMSNSLREYLTTKLEVYQIYHENNCLLSDNDVDTECIISLSDSYPELVQQAQKTTQLYNTIERYYGTLKASFMSDTQQIRETARGLNG